MKNKFINKLKFFLKKKTNNKLQINIENLLNKRLKQKKPLKINEEKIISNVFQLPEKLINDIMIPRTDIISVDTNVNINKLVQIIGRTSHSRYPVFDKSRDNIIGMIHIKDIISCWKNTKIGNIKKLVRQILFTPDSINILDVINMINMILGIIEPNLETADLNDDGIINILDVITLVNLVLGSRIIDMSENIGTDAVIYKTANSVSISANGNIAGIQLTVSANNLQINENIPMTVESNLVGDQHIILMYGLNGETLSGDKIQLFTASEDYEILSIIAANILSKAMNIEQRNGLLPETFELSQNFPNPFNPSTEIKFTVGKDELISLNIYDIQGRLVSSLIDNYFYSAGSYKMNWDGKNQYGTQVPSGMYLYKLESSNQIVTRKMVLMK